MLTKLIILQNYLMLFGFKHLCRSSIWQILIQFVLMLTKIIKSCNKLNKRWNNMIDLSNLNDQVNGWRKWIDEDSELMKNVDWKYIDKESQLANIALDDSGWSWRLDLKKLKKMHKYNNGQR